MFGWFFFSGAFCNGLVFRGESFSFSFSICIIKPSFRFISQYFCLLAPMFLQPIFCDGLRACTNSLFPFYYQFKFRLSPPDFDKPCFCLHVKTWFVKIKWRHGELELIVKREQKISKIPQIIAKRWLSLCADPLFFLWVGFLRAHLVPDVSFWWAPLLGLFCLRHARI